MVTIGGMSFEEEDIELLDKLLEVDGRNGSMYIYNEELCRNLRRLDYVQRNQIGWVWGTDKLRSTLPKLKKAFEQVNREEFPIGEG